MEWIKEWLHGVLIMLCAAVFLLSIGLSVTNSFSAFVGYVIGWSIFVCWQRHIYG